MVKFLVKNTDPTSDKLDTYLSLLVNYMSNILNILHMDSI